MMLTPGVHRPETEEMAPHRLLFKGVLSAEPLLALGIGYPRSQQSERFSYDAQTLQYTENTKYIHNTQLKLNLSHFQQVSPAGFSSPSPPSTAMLPQGNGYTMRDSRWKANSFCLPFRPKLVSCWSEPTLLQAGNFSFEN